MKVLEVEEENGVNANQFMVEIKEEKIDAGYQETTSGGKFFAVLVLAAFLSISSQISSTIVKNKTVLFHDLSVFAVFRCLFTKSAWPKNRG